MQVCAQFAHGRTSHKLDRTDRGDAKEGEETSEECHRPQEIAEHPRVDFLFALCLVESISVRSWIAVPVSLTCPVDDQSDADQKENDTEGRNTPARV